MRWARVPFQGVESRGMRVEGLCQAAGPSVQPQARSNLGAQNPFQKAEDLAPRISYLGERVAVPVHSPVVKTVRHASAAAWTTGIALGLLIGCGGSPEKPAPNEVPMDPRPVLSDLVAQRGSAEVVRPTWFVEPGNPEFRSFLHEGWARPEVHGESGRTFAWAAAQRVRFEMVSLDQGAAIVSVTGWPLRWRGSPSQTLEVVVNGESLGSSRFRRGRNEIDFDIPSGVLTPGVNDFELVFGYARSPAEVIEGATDERTLAAAIEKIEVRHFGASDPMTGSGEPVLDGSRLLLPSNTAVTYRLVPSGDVALDIEASLPEASEEGQRRIVAWLKPLGDPHRIVLDRPLGGQGLRSRIQLDEFSGRLLEIGIGAVGGGIAVDRVELVGGGRVDPLSNLLIIVMDTLRADYVGAYGGDVATPTIDRLADDGVLFERAYSHIPITGPSHSSLFTSLLPFEHGVHNNGQILDKSWRTLAETLQDSGWHTAAAVSLGVLKREFGYRRGFGVYLDTFGRDWMKDAGEVTDEVVEMVEEGLSSPYFLFVHYSDPHEPYTPPNLEYPIADLELGGHKVAELRADGRGNRIRVTVEPGRQKLRFSPRVPSRRLFRVDTLRVIGKGVEVEGDRGWDVALHERRSAATYTSRLPASLELVNDGVEPKEVALDFTFKEWLKISEVKERYRQEVEFADGQIGRLLDELESGGLLENTLVVFTSDHGEGLGQHNHLAHIHQVYDTLIRIPLILKLPGGEPKGLRVTDRVSLVDVFPTLAEILGVEPPSPISGRSMVPPMYGESAAARPIIAETYRTEAFTNKKAYISGRYKFIHSWSDEREWEELYDLEADPDELVDLRNTYPEVADRLRTELEERLLEVAHGRADSAELSQQELDRLQALGYVH